MRVVGELHGYEEIELKRWSVMGRFFWGNFCKRFVEGFWGAFNVEEKWWVGLTFAGSDWNR